MISLDVIDTDAFLEMPQSSQNLYFHLNARADDDGFVPSPKRIMRATGAQEDDFKLLMIKKFVISFDGRGVCVIKHWRINNFIRKDIYKATQYQDLKRTLFIRENGAYTLNDDGQAIPLPDGHFQVESLNFPCVNEASTGRQLRIGKVRIGKESKENTDKPYSSISYLTKIPTDDLLEFAKRFEITEEQIQSKAEDLKNYCDSKGKRYKNYRSFLLNALKKDFAKPEREKQPYFENNKLEKIGDGFCYYDTSGERPRRVHVDTKSVVWK